MKVALVIPGGVDQSGEYRVIPALLALLKRLSAEHSVHVFPLVQAPAPGEWDLCGARVHNVGAGLAPLKVVAAILKEHRVARFDIVHSIFSGSCGLAAVAAGYMLGVPRLVHVAGGELVALPDIQYGGRLKWRGRMREASDPAKGGCSDGGERLHPQADPGCRLSRATRAAGRRLAGMAAFPACFPCSWRPGSSGAGSQPESCQGSGDVAARAGDLARRSWTFTWTSSARTRSRGEMQAMAASWGWTKG